MPKSASGNAPNRRLCSIRIEFTALTSYNNLLLVARSESAPAKPGWAGMGRSIVTSEYPELSQSQSQSQAVGSRHSYSPGPRSEIPATGSRQVIMALADSQTRRIRPVRMVVSLPLCHLTKSQVVGALLGGPAAAAAAAVAGR